MKILMYIPHYGWAFGLASSMPNDAFYIINKVEPDEQRGSDLCVSNGFWQWVPALKPKPNNVKLLGQSFSDIQFNDYDVIMLIPDAGQIRFLKYVQNKIPIIWKFHLNNPESRRVFEDLKLKGQELPTLGYPHIFSSQTQKDFYNLEGEVAWSQSPEIYKDWKGEIKRVMWTCERIGLPGQTPPDIRYVWRGGQIWDQIHPHVNAMRYGLDFRLGTPITSFEELIFAYRFNRCYVECATNTILTDGLVEAMMTGMPVVVYPAWEMDKLIENGVNGFKSQDPAIMVKHIKKLLDDFDLAKEIGKEGRETALKYWNPSRSHQVYHRAQEKALEVFNKTTNKNRKILPESVYSSTADLFMLSTFEKRLEELETSFNKKHTGILECPYCFERLKIVHLKGEHSVEPFEKRLSEERRVPVLRYKWEPVAFSHEPEPEVKKEVLPKILKTDELVKKGLYKSHIPCPYCHSDLLLKDEDKAICAACRRILGSWIELITAENRES